MKKLAFLVFLMVLGISSGAEAQERWPGQIVIDARDDLSSAEISQLLREYGFLSIHTSIVFDSTKEIVVDVEDQEISTLLQKLSHDRRVEIAAPVYQVWASSFPNDPMYKDQWGMQKVNAPNAWDYSTGKGVVVAVIDTGVACYDRNGFHKLSDFKQTECVAGWNFIGNNDLAADDQSHGSHVSGTIAESTNNNLGAVGLAFQARIMPVKVLAASGGGSDVGVADGIRWAADHGANVINMSLSSSHDSEIMRKSVAYALSKGVVVVAAAGNSGGKIGYPGGTEGVIGVSATDETDALAKFSCRGPGIDLAAPGVKILQQTICDGGKNGCEAYESFNGTSMASPHVAAAAALVVGMGVSKPEAVEKYLRDSARKVDDSDAGKLLYGSGIVDAGAAVRRVAWVHGIWRLLAVLALTGWIGYSVRKISGSTSPLNWKFLLGAMVAGPGVLWVAPFFLPRFEVLTYLARPLADWDLFFWGQEVHRWLPFTCAIIPFILTAIFFGYSLGRQLIGGLSIGMAGYIITTIVLNETVNPLGRFLAICWLTLNLIGCLWFARVNLIGPEASAVKVK